MDSVTDPTVREVVVMKSAQVGWTEILGNVVGYHVHRDPAPILLIQPTLEMAEAWSKDRLAPMIRDTPALRDRIADSKSRDSGNTMLHKLFPGGHITMAGANSPASLASRPIRVVLCDEVDRYPASAGAEGDPVSLARKRATTFWNRKLLMGSTPTVKGESRIEMAFELSDKRYFFVPCPHCGTYERLSWPNVRWPEGKPLRAVYVCPHCGAEFGDADKRKSLTAGEWRATAEFTGIAGFHINELYSPWSTFGQIAQAFLEAKRSPETLKTWVNTSLGETFVEVGEAPSWERVAALRQPYSVGDVPDGALGLVAGVDVQKDRLVYAVRAFGHGMTSWLVEHGELWGSTDEPDVWTKLSGLLTREFGEEHIGLMLVDSGYRPDPVYQFVRRNPKARASKGHDEQAMPVRMSKLDVKRSGKVAAAGVVLWHIDTGYFKTWIHGRIGWPQEQAGAWLIPADATDDYCRQIVAESRITLPSGRAIWKRHDVNNHYLDCEVLCTAAAFVMGWHRLREPAPKPAEKPAAPQHPLVMKRPRRSFVNAWK